MTSAACAESRSLCVLPMRHVNGGEALGLRGVKWARHSRGRLQKTLISALHQTGNVYECRVQLQSGKTLAWHCGRWWWRRRTRQDKAGQDRARRQLSAQHAATNGCCCDQRKQPSWAVVAKTGPPHAVLCCTQ
jgi:hypothetical protein